MSPLLAPMTSSCSNNFSVLGPFRLWNMCYGHATRRSGIFMDGPAVGGAGEGAYLLCMCTTLVLNKFLTHRHNLRLISFSCSGAKWPDTASLKFLRAPPNPARFLIACPLYNIQITLSAGMDKFYGSDLNRWRGKYRRHYFWLKLSVYFFHF